MFFPTEAKSDFFLQKEKWESLWESSFCFGQKNIVYEDLNWVPLELFSKFVLEEEKIYRPHTAFASQ